MRNFDKLLRRTLRWMPVAALALLAGCGGGGNTGEPDPAAHAAPAAVSLDTLGPDGGKVRGAEGVVVQVPAEALETEVTVRVAADSTGAPALPATLRAIGSVFEITPHGHRFARGVTVRLPMPDATAQSDESLVILHAEPGGTWTTLAGEDRGDGMLEAEVDTLGWFAVGRFARSQALATTTQPIAWSMTTLCLGVPCPGSTNPGTGTFPVTVTVASNGGVLSNCASATLEVNLVEVGFVNALLRRSIKASRVLPVTGGTTSFSAARPTWTNEAEVEVLLLCGGVTSRTVNKSAALHWQPLPAYPRLLVEASPASLQAVPGTTASLQLTFAGGAARATTTAATAFTVPTDADRAVIDWQRSDDQGGSWRSIGTSYQNESGNVKPYAGWPAWRFWTMRTGIEVSATDAGARFRARACYVKPGTTESTCVTSRAVPLTLLAVTSAPVITTQPASRLVLAGQTASFTVAATGLPAPTLRWQSRPGNLSSDFADIAGATGTSYTTPVLQAGSNGVQYRVIATNAVGSTSSLPATVAVNAVAVKPTISTQPAPLTVVSGSDAAFAVRATGTEALSFQWRRNGVNLPGANGAVLRLAAVTSGQAGDYSVVVSNAAGSVTSTAARLTVNAVPPTVVPPTIAASPASLSVAQGQSASFAVSVTGTGPFAYQWRKGTVDIPGATAAGYSIASAQPGDAGSYSVVVTGSGTSVTSAAATLAVTPATAPVPPTITAQPASVVVVPGATTTLAVAASGTGPLAYQWFRDAAPLTGATGPTLTLSALDASANGSWTVTVSNALGSVTSAAAQLLVVGAPLAGVLPDVYEVVEGTTGSFSVSASGSQLRYQWTRNHVAIPGATHATYTTPVLTLADSGAVYGVIVYNGAGLSIVEGTVLTVTPAPVARSWQTPALLQNSELQTEGRVPELAVDAAGNVRAVWVEATIGGVTRVMSAHLTPAGGWGVPAAVHSTNNIPISQVQIAVDGLGNAIALWLQGANGTETVWASRYTPAGGWSAGQQLDTDGQSSDQSLRPLALAMDGAGNAIALWRHAIAGSGGWWGIFHSRFEPATGWTTPAALSLGANVTAASSPNVGFDAAGNAVAVWVQSGISGNNIASARWVPGSGWTTTEVIEASNDGASVPRVAVNASGSAAAVWVQSSHVWSNRYTPGAGWGSAVQVELTNPQPVVNPKLTIDASGNVLAVWEQLDPAVNRQLIWANRGVAGGGWGTPVAISGTALASYDPSLAGNANGRGMVVWRSLDPTVGRFITMTAPFTPGAGWQAAVAIDPTEQSRAPKVVLDGTGDATAVWPRVGANAYQVWASRYR